VPLIQSFRGGLNTRLPAHDPQMRERKQCVLMQNFRFQDEFIETIVGTRKYHGTSLGSDPVTALMPYYNDQTDDYKLLAASGGSIYKRDEVTNEFTVLASALSPNSIFSSVMRHGVMYIPSVNDNLKKYLGGNKVETVGGGATVPGSFRVIVWMKEIDRLFGISDNAVFGQISWCDLNKPEIWDAANTERIKLKEGERVEGAEYLYGKLIIFCTYTVWIYYVLGNEENWKPEEAPTAIGCPAPETIKKDGNKIIYLGESPHHSLGIYSFNGSTSELLTDDITPTLARRNKNKIRNACAEIHDDLYTFSIALDASETNNYTFDLDLVNRKEDGTPAIYGPHTFGFRSAAVLNTRQKNKEFLMGGEDDGFVYFENGNTFKSTDGNDGDAIEQSFLSAVYDDDDPETMKQFNSASLFLRPTQLFQAFFRYYVSHGTYSEDYFFNPSVAQESFAGEFDVHFTPHLGIPNFYQFKRYLELSARGTAIQFGIHTVERAFRLAFSGFGYDAANVYKTERVQSYVQ